MARLTVPKLFVTLAKTVVWHADPERFAQLYTLLWRLRQTPGVMGRQRGCGIGAALVHGEIRAARHAQDARFPALPRS